VINRRAAAAVPEVGRFEVLGVLGTGAEAVVLLAHDRADASPGPIGLKILKRRDDSSSLTRLRDEARILSFLCHRNIVQVHRLLEKDGLPIVVMEYVQGASAMELLLRHRDGLPAPVGVEIAHQAAIALDAGYNAPGPDGQPLRIVHRDIKPANLLVALDGTVKVVDFGIATGAFAQEDDGGDLMGTPGYVAPERRHGGTDTPAVDAYALGASLFGMLTGRLLVQSQTSVGHDPSVARALGHWAPAGVSPEAGEALRCIVGDLCRYDPESRPVGATLVARLAAVRDVVGAPDMAAFAAEHVAPLLSARAEAEPRRNPMWPQLAFLERSGDVRDLALETRAPDRGLALRETSEPADVAPLLAQLERRSRWIPWSQDRDPAELIAALAALCGTRDPRAVTRAFELTRHPNPGVAEAAWEVLAAAC
jgi:serine/threonine protein kinase